MVNKSRTCEDNDSDWILSSKMAIVLKNSAHSKNLITSLPFTEKIFVENS